MKKLLFSTLIFSSTLALAQNVGINSTGATPVTSAALDVDMANKGILIPRVALTITTAFAPVTGTATTSLMVYNTATASSGATAVTPGYYYWDGAKWVRFINSNGGGSWEILGNTATVQGTNFLGTTDNVGIDIRTNNTLRQRIFNTGETTFNSATGFIGDIVGSYATGTNDALNGYLTGSGAGRALFISNASTDNTSVSSQSVSTSAGYNTYAESSSATNTRPVYVGIHGSTTGNGIATFVGGTTFTTFTNGAAGTFSHPTTAIYGIARNTTNSTGGIFAGNNSTAFSLTSGSGLAANGTTTGLVALAQTTTNSIGAYISGNNATFTGPATGGAGIAVNSTILATYSRASGTANDTWGGYFENGTTFAYVGGRTGGTNYKINGPGAVSTIVDDLNGNKVNMFCPEAPEVLFQDYGVGQLINGSATILIDPILVNNIFVDASHPLKVFVQLEGDCNGVYVTSKSQNGFKVVELQNGQSNTSFSWSIVASRKDTKLSDGTLDSKFQDVRFPTSPSRIQSEIKTRQSNTQETTPGISTTKGKVQF